VRDEAGKEQSFARAQADLPGYLANLGSQDAVMLEAFLGGTVLGGAHPNYR
jgi:hypothetical protein